MSDEMQITPEMRKKAEEKPTFNILFVGEGESRLSLFRGESMIRTFASFYSKFANISYMTTTPAKLNAFPRESLLDVNILWLDNCMDARLVTNIATVQSQILDAVSPDWRKELNALKEESEDKAVEFIKVLKAKRASTLRVIYALDEFIWEAPVGRSVSLQGVKLVESYFSVADSVVLPNSDLKDAIEHFGYCPAETDFVVIPTAVTHEFFPLYKDMNRTLVLNATANTVKPKVLVKGVTLSKNVMEFITSSYKDYDITVSSVGELSEAVMGLIGRKKIKHIHHWANPQVNKTNFTHGYALERDMGFDFLVYSFPDDLNDKMYELTMGDEDVLFAVASGALPICGSNDVGYEGNHLYNSSGVTFGSKNSGKDISEKIRILFNNHLKFNEALNRSRAVVENRIATSPNIIGGYFAAMIGRELYTAKAKMAKEMADKEMGGSETTEQEPKPSTTQETPAE